MDIVKLHAAIEAALEEYGNPITDAHPDDRVAIVSLVARHVFKGDETQELISEAMGPFSEFNDDDTEGELE